MDLLILLGYIVAFITLILGVAYGVYKALKEARMT